MATEQQRGLMGQALPPERMPVDAPVEEMDEADEEVTPEELEAYETMVSALRSHIFGAAEEGIRAKLRQSQDVAADVGAMMLPLVMEAGKQAEASGIEADFDLLVSVGTEIIDDLLEIAEAMGVIDEVTDDLREKAMFSAIRAYLVSADVPPEELEMAKQQLASLKESGDFDRVAKDVQAKAIRDEGIDPFAGGEQVPSRPRMMEG